MSQRLGNVNQYLYEKIYDEIKEEILSGQVISDNDKNLFRDGLNTQKRK